MSRVAKRNEKKKDYKKKAMIGAGSLVALYLSGALFFSTHYFPNTKMGDIDIGMKSNAEAKTYLETNLADFSLTIQEPEGKEVLTAEDAGLSYTDLDSIDAVLEEQKFMTWFARLNTKYPHKGLKVQVDSDKLSASIDELSCMSPADPIESKSAKIEYDKDDKTYKIKDEVIGNIVDKDHFLEGTSEAFCNLNKNISLVEKTYYKQPKYKADSKEVIKARDTMNKYLKGTITYKDGKYKQKLTKGDISKFVKCSKDFEVSVDKGKVKSYVKKKVSKTFNSLDGEIPSGLTAWKVDVGRESRKIIKTVKAGKKLNNRKPIYANKGLDRDDGNLGRTFIDINISNQQLWYVENGSVALSSDIVTGNVSAGRSTPTGIYSIAYKQRDHLMVKYNAFVHYWMPFITSTGIGLHDANWRSQFGGNIYQYDGSHGCINMPPSKAAALYSMVSAGTTVYVHY
ncbi:MAG: L,D-transpeptidase family protein [Eubacterium sp.]|nr:L,D-transpeptidase family protein [Eubacterium sp.]